MYPNISDLLKDVFGLNWKLPIQTFGFFVAIAFLGAAYVLSRELKRREKLGWLLGYEESYWIGKPLTSSELLFNGLIGFVLGYKLFPAFSHWSAFSMAPQSFLMNLDGNWAAGLALGGVFALWNYLAKKRKTLKEPILKKVLVMPHQRVGDFTVIAAIAGLIGAKLFDALENWHLYMSDPLDNFFSFSGLTYYGGLILAAIAMLWYARSKNINGWQLVDSAGPALMLAYGLGRIGCHMAGDGDWGIPNTHPKPWSWLPDWLWSYTYPHNINNAGIPIPGCTGPHCFQLPVGVYPTSLYELIACLILFSFLWSIRKRISIPGVLFGIYLILNGVERFLIELIRVNNRYHFFGISATQAEIISLLLVISGILLIAYCRKRHKPLGMPAATGAS